MDETQKKQMWEQFKALEAEAISMNHYDLAKVTNIKDVQLWKEFLTSPDVASYIEQESQILTQTQLRKLSSNVSESRSVGQAQLINAMQKLSDNTTTKEGPIFIYSYVPLTSNQAHAPNVRSEMTDIFLKTKNDPVELTKLKRVLTEEPVAPTTMNLNSKELTDDDLF